MKQNIRYQSLLISGKLKTEIRISIDDKGAEFGSNNNGDINTYLTFYPWISVIIVHPPETDEGGNKVKPIWNPNNSLGMSKYTLPIFLDNINSIKDDMKISNLYTYTGKRLELNEDIAGKIRRVFMIGNTTVELSAVVINQLDDSRVEGIKMKFNNEQSSVLLTLNDLEALVFNLRTMDVDSISLLLYLNYVNKPSRPKSFDRDTLNTKVDIAPLRKEFDKLDVAEDLPI